MKKLISAFDIKKHYGYIVSPVIAVAIVLVAFALGGVFPFGKHTANYYDMSQGVVPAFYHIWDALHSGDTALWFNWKSGLGVNDSNIASLSVFWLVLYVIPRRTIEKAMSIYVVMMFAGAAFSSNVFLRYTYKVKPYWCVMLSLCYTFCGFSVMYYVNAWLDTVMLFPLFMTAWYLLMKKGNVIPYIIMIIVNLMCGYYIFTLMMFYIFFLSWFYIKLCVQKDLRKKRVWQLGVSTILAFGLSAPFYIPKVIQAVTSERVESGTELSIKGILTEYFDIATTVNIAIGNKWRMLFAASLPAVIVIIGFVKRRKDKKVNGFFAVSIALIAVMIVCEGTNLIMHVGSYNAFPIRMAYGMSFCLMWAAGYYTQYIKFNKVSLKNKHNIGKVALSAVVGIVLFMSMYCGTYKILNNSNKKLVILELFVVFIGYLIVVSLFVKFKAVDYRAITAMVLAETLALTMVFIPYWNSSTVTNENKSEYIAQSQKVYKDFDMSPSNTQRVKTIGTTLNCNYGTIMGRATVSDWTHLIPESARKSLINLGYSSEFTRIHDSGGTAFSDALFGITNVISVKEESPDLYTKIDESGNYNYYKCKYTIPYGVVAPYSSTTIDWKKGDWIDNQNELYSAISGDNQGIISDANVKLVSTKNKVETYKFKAKKNSIAYLRIEGCMSVKVKVNGQYMVFPSVTQEKRTTYPARFNRGVICLGDFGDSEVTIEIDFTKGMKLQDTKDFMDPEKSATPEYSQYYKVAVGTMDLQKLNNICQKYKNEDNNIETANYSLKANATAKDDNQLLLLPLQYNGGWKATVNGNRVDVLSVAGIFSAVQLQQGENQVEMHFSPPGFISGVIIMVCFMAAGLILLFCKIRKLNIPNIVESSVSRIYDLAVYIGLTVAYVIPLGYLVYFCVKKAIEYII